jgi:osmoprotectant transport system permease protein
VRYLFGHPGVVAEALGQHLALTFVSLGIALVVAVPLGIAAAKWARTRGPIFGVLGVIYTIPSLALLALLVPFEGLGFWTAVTALAAYAQMILVRNITTGILGVDHAVLEAARGMGMNAWQLLWRVETPLAMPVAIGGVRIAVVSIIGIANVAAWINAGGLGTLVLDGIERDYPDKALAGAIVSAVLAIAADLTLRAYERRFRISPGHSP